MKAIFALALCGALALGGCATSGGSVTPTPTPVTTSGDPTIDAIQAAAVRACSFLPTVSTVSQIVVTIAYPQGEPLASYASQVAAAICGAVTPKSARLRNALVPAVNGVPIEGQFVSGAQKAMALKRLRTR